MGKNEIYQVSLLQALAYGDYHGSITAAELKAHGDTGIGTFDRLNGELILLDGVISEMKELGLETPTTEERRRVMEQWQRN